MTQPPSDVAPDKARLRRVADGYSADAEIYERTWAPVLRPYGRLLLERLPLPAARRVLDAGAGVGTLLPDIQAAAPSATVIAVDLSAGMLCRAPASHPRAVMNLGRLGLMPCTFDAVVMAFMLFHLPDPLRALGEALRVLTPGGAAGTITWDGEPDFPAQNAFMEELDARGAEPADPAFTNHEPVDSPEKMRALLEAAGFSGIQTWTARFAHPYDPAQFVAIRTARGSSRRRFESLDPGGRATFLDRVGARLSGMTQADFVDRAELTYAIAVRG